MMIMHAYGLAKKKGGRIRIEKNIDTENELMYVITLTLISWSHDDRYINHGGIDVSAIIYYMAIQKAYVYYINYT